MNWHTWKSTYKLAYVKSTYKLTCTKSTKELAYLEKYL